jgi:GDP-D-mannose 3',5'-epimerase
MDGNKIQMKTALCLGGTGFIGHHLARRLKSEGYFVRVVDIKAYEYGENDFADEVVISDLRNYDNVEAACRLQGEYSFLQKAFEEVRQFDLVFALCCNMGGAAYVFTGEHDGEILHDSALMNLNIAEALRKQNFKGKLFYSSSACMYPQELQKTTTPGYFLGTSEDHSGLRESDAYPLNPDSDYGLEKAFSERLYLAYARNYGLNIRIARFHNIYGPEGTYAGGKEKAPAAICRKIASSTHHANYGTGRGIATIDVWGDGMQTRSFLYIDDCIDAVRLLMESDFKQPINIGSEEMISINDLTKMVAEIGQKAIRINNVPGPVGVRGRNSDNTLIEATLGWKPKYSLRQGMEKLYKWVKSQVNGL